MKIEIELEDLKALIELASDLDRSNHWDRGNGPYEENEFITAMRKKYLDVST